MNQAVMIAYSGGMDYAYLLDVLAHLAAHRQQAVCRYSPTRVSRQGCSEYCIVWLGDSPLSKEPMPESVDVLVALEELEGRRQVRFLRKEGVCVLCSAHRLPMAVAVGTMGYPNDIEYRMVQEGRRIYRIKRVDIQPARIACAMLRGLGCERDLCLELLAGMADAEAAVSYAFALTYAK